MYLADCHTHSRCSSDGSVPLTELAAAAARAGLSGLCVTDHLDLILHGGLVLEDWDWAPLLQQYEQAGVSCPEGLELRFGIEIGSAQFLAERAGQLLAQAPLDLVIGSAHNMNPALGGLDFIELTYQDEATCFNALNDYFDSLLMLSGMECIDVLGHLPYVLRYMNDRDGNRITLDSYTERIETVLRNLIHRGGGLELNTNRARGNLDARWRPILECYYRLGGEIVTLGSDAHRAEDVGRGIPDGIELLQSIGFRYHTVYRQRKPEFIPF